MFDHLADPHPPTDLSAARRRVEHRLRRRRQHHVAGGVAAGVAVVLAGSTLIALHTGTHGDQVVTAGTPAATPVGVQEAEAGFLTVEGSDFVGRQQLQERAASDGRLEAVLLDVAAHDLVASWTPDGDVLAAVLPSQCGGHLSLIDPTTRKVTDLGALSGTVEVISGLTVSADGRYAA